MDGTYRPLKLIRGDDNAVVDEVTWEEFDSTLVQRITSKYEELVENGTLLSYHCPDGSEPTRPGGEEETKKNHGSKTKKNNQATNDQSQNGAPPFTDQLAQWIIADRHSRGYNGEILKCIRYHDDNKLIVFRSNLRYCEQAKREHNSGPVKIMVSLYRSAYYQGCFSVKRDCCCDQKTKETRISEYYPITNKALRKKIDAFTGQYTLQSEDEEEENEDNEEDANDEEDNETLIDEEEEPNETWMDELPGDVINSESEESIESDEENSDDMNFIDDEDEEEEQKDEPQDQQEENDEDQQDEILTDTSIENAEIDSEDNDRSESSDEFEFFSSEPLSDTEPKNDDKDGKKISKRKIEDDVEDDFVMTVSEPIRPSKRLRKHGDITDSNASQTETEKEPIQKPVLEENPEITAVATLEHAFSRRYWPNKKNPKYDFGEKDNYQVYSGTRNRIWSAFKKCPLIDCPIEHDHAATGEYGGDGFFLSCERNENSHKAKTYDRILTNVEHIRAFNSLIKEKTQKAKKNKVILSQADLAKTFAADAEEDGDIIPLPPKNSKAREFYLFNTKTKLYEVGTDDSLAEMVHQKLCAHYEQIILDHSGTTEGNMAREELTHFKNQTAGWYLSVGRLAIPKMKKHGDFAGKLLIGNSGVLPIKDGKAIELCQDEKGEWQLKTRARTKKDLFTFEFPFSYDEKSSFANVIPFVEDLLGKEGLEPLQRLAGAAVFNLGLKHILFIVGPEADNGKTAFLNMIANTFRQLCRALPKDYLMKPNKAKEIYTNSSGTSHQENIADVVGARFLTAAENTADQVLHETNATDLICGDLSQKTKKYGSPVETKGWHPLVLCFMNHVPQIPNGEDPKSKALRKKILMTTTKKVYVEGRAALSELNEREIDPDFMKEMESKEEQQNFFNWVLQGAIKYKKDGAMIPGDWYKTADQTLQSHIRSDNSPDKLHKKALAFAERWWTDQIRITGEDSDRLTQTELRRAYDNYVYIHQAFAPDPKKKAKRAQSRLKFSELKEFLKTRGIKTILHAHQITFVGIKFPNKII